MSEMQPQPNEDRKTDRWLEPGPTNVQVIYILYLVGFVIGVSALVGIVLAHINRGKVNGWVETHYVWAIRTFWIGLLFGFARGAVIVVLAWLALDYMITEDERPGWIQEAKSRPLVERGADMLLTLVPEELLERGDQAAEDARRRAEEVRRAEQTYQQLVSPLRKSDAETEQPTYNEGMRDEIEKAIEGLMTDETAPGETTQ